MVDQNPQVNQNVNNQSENDELFWWSDDIFENSDLLQPIDSEVATAHEVIKSQNDLNNFHWEVQNNAPLQPQQVSSESQTKPIAQETAPNNVWNINNEQINSDDLFGDNTKYNDESDAHLNNLYDEAPIQEKNDAPINDDIFEENPIIEDDIEKIPEIEDIAEENEQQESSAQTEISNEIKQPEIVSQPEIVDNPEIVEEVNSENIQESSNNNQEIEDNTDDNIDNLQDIDDLDDFDDIDELDEIQDWEENTEEWKINTENTVVKETIVPEKDEEDIEDDEEVEQWFMQNNEKFEEENNEVDIAEESDEEEQESSDDDIENSVIQNYEKYDPNLFKTDVQKKFWELQRKTEKIHELVWKDMDVWFDLLWWNDDRKKIIYRILSGSDYVEIEKEELNKEDNSTITNILAFELSEDLEQNMSVQLYVNDIELYDEIKDLQNDPNKKMQVLEKMNKFIFLLDEEYKKIQKYKKEKEERNAVKWVFRNF